MSLKKRFTGDLTIESVDSGNTFVMKEGGGVSLTVSTPVIAVTSMVIGTQYRIITLGTTDFTTLGSSLVTSGSFTVGEEYIISVPGTTDFTLIGAADSVAGTVFTATGPGIGDGTALETVFTATAVGAGTGTVKSIVAVVIDGDLTVLGTSTSIQSVNTDIVDNTIILNSGETGPGVSAGTAGIEIDRGDGISAGETPAGLRFNEGSDRWELNNGDGTWDEIDSGAAGFNLVSDLSPQLGGDLDVNGSAITNDSGPVNITTTTSGDINLTSVDAAVITGTTATTVTSPGLTTLSSSAADIEITAATELTFAAGTFLKVDHNLSMLIESIPAVNPGLLPNYNTLSAGVVGPGGSGLYFVNNTITDELVSKKRAIAYSIIF